MSEKPEPSPTSLNKDDTIKSTVKSENGVSTSCDDSTSVANSQASTELSDVSSSQAPEDVLPSDLVSVEYDPIKELDWSDGVATLPGSNFKVWLKFCNCRLFPRI